MFRGKDIAARLGVSKQTVSAVLSGRWRERRICTQTRDRVLITARKMGYVPHHAARRLARARSDSQERSFDQVGLIYLGDFNLSHAQFDLAKDPVWLSIMAGAERSLGNIQTSLVFIRVARPDDWNRVEKMMQAGSIDGWLLYGPVDDQVRSRFKAHKLPYVIVGDHRCTQPVHSVNVDNAAVGRMAVQHLASLGHRRIGLLSSGVKHVYEKEILDGFRAALKEFGMDDDERLIVNPFQWDWNLKRPTEETAKPTLDWLHNTKPTALFAPELDFAAMAYQVLKALQIEVPKDISLVSYEIASASTAIQDFTRVELPMGEVGSQGALLLHKIVLGQARLEQPEIRIAPTVIQGWSSSAPSTIGLGKGIAS